MSGPTLVRLGERLLNHNAIDYELKINTHAKFYVEYEGRKAVLITSLTTSDHRAQENFYHQVKRCLQGLGFSMKKDSKTLVYK